MSRCSPSVAPRLRVAVVTGARSEYGVLRSTIAAIAAHPRLELQLVVCGMHLLRRFGYTIRDIQRDRWPIAARIPMQRGDDSPTDQARGLARGVRGIARFLEEARSDVVLVLGDRIEAMAGALAAVLTGRTLAHVHGGDVAPGDFDDRLRDAITRLADLHFVASRDAKRRVLRLGADRRRVFLTGAPGLDRVREALLRAGHALRIGKAADRTRGGAGARHAERSEASCPHGKHSRAAGRGRRASALVVYHAHGRPAHVERRTMVNILATLRTEGLATRVIFPNTDRGNAGVLHAIQSFKRSFPGTCRRNNGRPGAAGPHPPIAVFRSVPHDEYLRMLGEADVLVGNSSSGIIEAPFVGTPSVNVGGRQRGRLAGGPSVLHADESQRSIRAALRRALRRRSRRRLRSSVYGDGKSGARIARVLAGCKATRSQGAGARVKLKSS